jgi:hypothetical protein
MPELGGTLSPTSLISSAWMALNQSGRTRRRVSCSQPDDSSFARVEENKWEAEDGVVPIMF